KPGFSCAAGRFFSTFSRFLPGSSSGIGSVRADSLISMCLRGRRRTGVPKLG
ncbi:hypothetical protein XENOCAPTIV_021086, partial [Xenoophorus captivus]